MFTVGHKNVSLPAICRQRCVISWDHRHPSLDGTLNFQVVSEALQKHTSCKPLTQTAHWPGIEWFCTQVVSRSESELLLQSQGFQLRGQRLPFSR